MVKENQRGATGKDRFKKSDIRKVTESIYTCSMAHSENIEFLAIIKRRR